MTLVVHDYVPDEMTPGEYAAILDADARGWINPPLYCSFRPEPVREWRTVHCRYLERRQLIREVRRRLDGQTCFRLNADGLALRERTIAEIAEWQERLAA